MGKIKVPGWASGFRVDEAIECLDYAEGESSRVTRALLEAMPDAYADDNHDEHGEAIIEDRTEYRTSKTFAARSLAAIWGKLPDDIRAALSAAYDRTYGDAEDHENLAL